MSDDNAAESSPGIDQLESDTSANVAGALEALLMLAAEPVTEFELAQAVGVLESVVAETLAELVAFTPRPDGASSSGRSVAVAVLHP